MFVLIGVAAVVWGKALDVLLGKPEAFEFTGSTTRGKR